MPMWLLRLWPFGLAILVFIVLKLALNEYNSAQRDTAAIKEVSSQQGKVIENATKATEARQAVADPTRYTKYCQCLQSTRTPGSCERHLPNDGADHSKPTSMCKAT